MHAERFTIGSERLEGLIDDAVRGSPYATRDEARRAGWAFTLGEALAAAGAPAGGPRPVDELWSFAYLLCARDCYVRPPGFGAKAVFPVVDDGEPGGPRLRLDVCVDGGPAVRSPAFAPEVIVGPPPADFDAAVQRLEEIAAFLAEAGTKLIAAARAFAH